MGYFIDEDEGECYTGNKISSASEPTVIVAYSYIFCGRKEEKMETGILSANWQLCFGFNREKDFLKVEVTDGKLVTYLGKREEFTPQKARRAAAFAVKKAAELGMQEARFVLAGLCEVLPATQGVQAALEGAMLAQYTPQSWKSTPPKPAVQLQFDFDGLAVTQEIEAAVQESEALARSVMLARDLVNEPANLLTPEIMAEKMKDGAQKAGLQAEIVDEKQAKALGMEAFLTVGSSALHPPRLIVLRYNGAPQSQTRLALVGKGVTCDTGGYCLKPASAMMGIKGDMAGAAAVYGAMLALAGSGASVNAVAVIPAAENRIAPGSYIPGDVIGSMAGKSIEIGNTDAEGRLLLADAVTYAIQKEGATHIADIATLTGAVVAMFGFTTAGVLCNNDGYYARFEQAAGLAGEQYWRLPIFPEYDKMIDSQIADVSNVSSDGCGTITAGLFIARFAQGLPWLHMDIAGTAWVNPPKWEYQSKGATGAGVTTLYHLCKQFAKGDKDD